MYMQRKAYNKLLEWKNSYATHYAALLEGPRRVGKSTVVEHFASHEYRSYVLIDFSQVSREVLACFDDIADLDMFFIRLQAATGTTLYEHASVLIFDEVQLFPRARQAVKHLVKDGRYHVIETGSLISIQKNVKDILIPSEEMKIPVYPMDYEEFCWATQQNFEVIRTLYAQGKHVGSDITRKLMRDLRIYMAVGGMPQAVEAYVNGKNFQTIDHIKRQIIELYEADFRKIDASGKLSALFHSIPAQLARGTRKYRISSATGKRRLNSDNRLISDLIDSRTVLACYNSSDPSVALSQTKDLDSYKLYLADTGLFVTLMFSDRSQAENEIYTKLLSDKLPANLGYLYENLVAQIIASTGRELFYHTWDGDQSSHYYEVDFLITCGTKVHAFEVKSSGLGKYESLRAFCKKYSSIIARAYVLSQKDFAHVDEVNLVPLYAIPALLEKC